MTKGVNVGKLFIKSALHGLSRGVISMAQGGTFKSGFASGFTSSFFSPGTEIGGTGTGGFTVRTAIASIVGGTASKIGGGKFSNGAVSGAFVHMFNAEGAGTLKNIGEKIGEMWGSIKNYISTGIGGGLHVGFLGVNGQHDATSNVLTVCVRLVPRFISRRRCTSRSRIG